MAARPRFQVGAPGVYRLPAEPLRALTGERMDVCAFAGVAPRGPAREPVFDADWAPHPAREGETVTRSLAVPVESWDEYARLYGSYEGPGLLPYAVASFFENGGSRAYVIRIVHAYAAPDGTPDLAAGVAGIARAAFADLRASGGGGEKRVWVAARNEGRWGNRLTATLSFHTRPLALAATAFTNVGFVFPPGLAIGPGTTLRLDLAGAGAVRVIVRVARVWEEWHPERAVREGHASFDAFVPGAITAADIVEGELLIKDGAGRQERHQDLGFASEHPRWIARMLVEESELLYPGDDPTVANPDDPRRSWYTGDALLIDASLDAVPTAAFEGGADRYADIVPADFFDDRWVLGDADPGDGVHTIVDTADVSLLVAPDLYSPEPLATPVSIVDANIASGDFEECVPRTQEREERARDDLDGLRLDPAADLEIIIGLQQRLLDLADVLESFVVLLDVPPGLSQRRILTWRARLASMYAAAYHPWLEVSRPGDRRASLVRVNPSAVAAGIIARREHEAGVQYGPANVLAAGVVNVVDHVSAARHDELHPNAINVFLPERDGVRLTAARTLSPEPPYRQLSVRRLVTMLRRVLYRQMQWVVFEPNGAALRDDVRHELEAFLRQLFFANAFSGARPEDAFFVRCDDELNPPWGMDQGRLVAHVGVAPAEPLEFLVLEITRDGDGTLRVQE